MKTFPDIWLYTSTLNGLDGMKLRMGAEHRLHLLHLVLLSRAPSVESCFFNYTWYVHTHHISGPEGM